MSHSFRSSLLPTDPDQVKHDGALFGRTAIWAGLTLSAISAPATEAARTRGDDRAPAVAALIARADRANIAFMQGDMKAWFGHAGPISGDFTLMQPFGGPASHGFDSSTEHLNELAGYFTGGEARLEIVETYASADLVVLVFIERQRGQVGGLPDQDWSLRVTQVYRRRGESWEFVHRHADPLVRNIGLDRAAALARGA